MNNTNFKDNLPAVYAHRSLFRDADHAQTFLNSLVELGAEATEGVEEVLEHNPIFKRSNKYPFEDFDYWGVSKDGTHVYTYCDTEDYSFFENSLQLETTEQIDEVISIANNMSKEEESVPQGVGMEQESVPEIVSKIKYYVDDKVFDDLRTAELHQDILHLRRMLTESAEGKVRSDNIALLVSNLVYSRLDDAIKLLNNIKEKING